MSRIGKRPVEIPSGVTASVEGQTVKVKGPKGELSFTCADEVAVSSSDGAITVAPKTESQQARALWGMSRTMVQNLIDGVTNGYTRELEIQGVGYRAAVQGQTLNLQLGLSHDVNYKIPTGIQIQCPKPTEVVVTGIEKQRVGQVAAEIRKFRPPEPFQGKGVRYKGEYILRKEGQKK